MTSVVPRCGDSGECDLEAIGEPSLFKVIRSEAFVGDTEIQYQKDRTHSTR